MRRQRMSAKAAAGLAAALMLGAACAPGIQVTRLRPARYNLGAARKMAVLRVDGAPDASALVLASLQRAIVNRNYYTLINAVSRNITIVVPGVGARVDVGGVADRVDADAYVLASVLRCEVEETEREESRTENGRKFTYLSVTPEGKARISFQVVRRDGQVIVMDDYSGRSSAPSFDATKRRAYSRGDLLENAVRSAVDSFMWDVTPRQVVEKIELDESLDALKPGVKAASEGDLRGAESSWNAVLSGDPNNAGAIYNLGVLQETRGDFDAASASYRRASQLSPKPLYRAALENLERRLREAQSLQQPL